MARSCSLSWGDSVWRNTGRSSRQVEGRGTVVRIPGRRVHHLCARPGRGCPQDFAGGSVEAREDSSPPREDEDVESERHHTCRRRRTHSISAGVGPRRSCVAREPRTAHLSPRDQSFGCSHRTSGFCGGVSGQKTREHELLFERIPAMEDLQSAWLVLLFCAAPRANFWLRSVRPELVQQFAASHDANTWGCLARMIGVQDQSAHPEVMASLQFSFGGLG